MVIRITKLTQVAEITNTINGDTGRVRWYVSSNGKDFTACEGKTRVPKAPAWTHVAGTYDGNFDNAGEDVDLIDSTGQVIFSVNYRDSDPWPVSADGNGATLELVDPQVSGELQGKWYNWRGSSRPDGTPGTAGDESIGVVINEVIANTRGQQSDAIELLNTTDQPIDVSGWWLSDAAGDRQKFPIPAGQILPAGGYLVFD